MSCFLSVLWTCLGLLLSPATRMPVLKPSLGYSEQDTRLSKTGESSFIPRYWWLMLLWSSSQNSHHHELEHDHLGVYYSSDQSCWNDHISAILWVFVRAFSPASLLSACQTEYKGSVPTYLHGVRPHSIRHRGQVYCSTMEMHSWLCKRVEPLHEAFGEYELEYLACLFIIAII